MWLSGADFSAAGDGIGRLRPGQGLRVQVCRLRERPPFGIGVAEADFFADTLDRVLTEGW